MSKFCKRVFWFFYSRKNLMLEEEKARSRFPNLSNDVRPYVLLDLVEPKHAPKKAGDCWLAGEALNNRRDRPTLQRYG